jgi:hypothetical protein
MEQKGRATVPRRAQRSLSAPFIPAIVNRSWTPPSGPVYSASLNNLNLASRAGPFSVMKDGSLLAEWSKLSFQNEICGLLSGLEPPGAGYA